MVWLGSLADAKPGQPTSIDGESARLVVTFDGRVALNGDQVLYPVGPQSLVAGVNSFGSAVAREEFTGRIAGIRQVAMESLPPAEKNGAYGAIDMTVEFPLGALGTQEPLVVTGVAGAGDMVYLRYVDAGHVLFGFDHLGIGGSIGEPVSVDYRANHRIAVVFQALYPPGSLGHGSDLVRVKLDGTTVLESHWACHPTAIDQISIGKNPIGGSTCGVAFTGRILADSIPSAHRHESPRPLAACQADPDAPLLNRMSPKVALIARRAPWAELLRILILVSAALAVVAPLLTGNIVGGVDARWYGYMLGDYIEQARQGHFLVTVGQGPFAWNGSVHLYRSAPVYMAVGRVVDLLTFHRLNLFALQHLTAIASAVAGPRVLCRRR